MSNETPDANAYEFHTSGILNTLNKLQKKLDAYWYDGEAAEGIAAHASSVRAQAKFSNPRSLSLHWNTASSHRQSDIDRLQALLSHLCMMPTSTSTESNGACPGHHGNCYSDARRGHSRLSRLVRCECRNWCWEIGLSSWSRGQQVSIGQEKAPKVQLSVGKLRPTARQREKESQELSAEAGLAHGQDTTKSGMAVRWCRPLDQRRWACEPHCLRVKMVTFCR